MRSNGAHQRDDPALQSGGSRYCYQCRPVIWVRKAVTQMTESGRSPISEAQDPIACSAGLSVMCHGCCSPEGPFTFGAREK
jgi:hypothetical protein